MPLPLMNISVLKAKQAESAVEATHAASADSATKASGADSGFSVTGDLSVSGDITADEIVENMEGYSFTPEQAPANLTVDIVYAGIVKNGNKLTFVIASNITRTGTAGSQYIGFGTFGLPSDVSSKIYPSTIDGINFVDVKRINALKTFIGNTEVVAYTQKNNDTGYLAVSMFSDYDTAFDIDTPYFVRYEVTILLSDNLVSND